MAITCIIGECILWLHPCDVFLRCLRPLHHNVWACACFSWWLRPRTDCLANLTVDCLHVRHEALVLSCFVHCSPCVSYEHSVHCVALSVSRVDVAFVPHEVRYLSLSSQRRAPGCNKPFPFDMVLRLQLVVPVCATNRVAEGPALVSVWRCLCSTIIGLLAVNVPLCGLRRRVPVVLGVAKGGVAVLFCPTLSSQLRQRLPS